MFIVDWWNSLSIVSQIFALVGIASTLVLLVQTVMMFLGMDDDADGVDDTPDGVTLDDDADAVSELEGLEGLRVLTVRGIIAFLVVFGWVGVAMDSAGLALWITLPTATLGGFLMMLVLALLMRAVMKLRSDGSADNRNAIGVAGKVYLTIPPARSGAGKVNLMLQGSYVERNAVTDDKEAIPTGSEVVVVALSGQTDLVVRKK